MKNIINILFAIASTLIIFGCNVSSSKLPKQDKLKFAICNSIDVPFHYGDTIIYNSFVGICGNSSKAHLNRYYQPRLNEQPYFDTLKSKYNGVFLCTNDSLYALLNKQCKNNSDNSTAWDCFSKNKINFQVTGEALTNKSVKIYETYGYNKEFKLITKIFTYDNNEWTYKIDSANSKD